MATKPELSLEQTLPEGQLANVTWLKARGFNRPRIECALRAGKLTAVATASTDGPDLRSGGSMWSIP